MNTEPEYEFEFVKETVLPKDMLQGMLDDYCKSSANDLKKNKVTKFLQCTEPDFKLLEMNDANNVLHGENVVLSEVMIDVHSLCLDSRSMVGYGVSPAMLHIKSVVSENGGHYYAMHSSDMYIDLLFSCYKDDITAINIPMTCDKFLIGYYDTRANKFILKLVSETDAGDSIPVMIEVAIYSENHPLRDYFPTSC